MWEGIAMTHDWRRQESNKPLFSVMYNAVGCYAYGNIFSCMAFKLYLGSSEDIPTEQIEELALFSEFRDAPIPSPGMVT